MAYAFKLSDIVPAPPRAIYDAWLDSRGHTAMTGSAANASRTIGGAFTAWGGYIRGKNLDLDPGKRIVQLWRTTRFTDTDTDSIITVTLTAVEGGTRVTLVHSNVPDGHTGYENGGWRDHYFEPMKRYFAKHGAKAAPAAKPKSSKRKIASAKATTAKPSRRKSVKKSAAESTAKKRRTTKPGKK